MHDNRTPSTFWADYGRLIRFMAVLYSVSLMPLVVLFLVNPAEGAARLRILGISVAMYAIVIVPTLVIVLRRDRR